VTERVEALAATAKLGTLFIVRAIDADEVNVPEVPVTTMVAEPVEALAPTARVMTCVPATVPGLKDAVTPFGSPVAARVTAPAKPPWVVVAMVSVADNPAPKFRVELEGASVKPCFVEPNHKGRVAIAAGLLCGVYPSSLLPGGETLQDHQKTPFIHAVCWLKTSKNAS